MSIFQPACFASAATAKTSFGVGGFVKSKPKETATGALAAYVSNDSVVDFQPMNINFGIITPLGYRVKGKRNKNAEISKRSLALVDEIAARCGFSAEGGRI